MKIERGEKKRINYYNNCSIEKKERETTLIHRQEQWYPLKVGRKGQPTTTSQNVTNYRERRIERGNFEKNKKKKKIG